MITARVHTAVRDFISLEMKWGLYSIMDTYHRGWRRS